MFVALLLALSAPPALAGGGPQNLLVLVNDESQESLDVANYYRRARQVPGVCLCHLQLKPAHDVSQADYEEKILKPALAHIRENGLEGEIRVVVFTSGLPYRIDWPGLASAVSARRLSLWSAKNPTSIPS